MATGERVDPFRNFNFYVEINGITQAGFSECSTFSSNTDPIEYREGGMPKHVRKLAGMTKFSNITLKWGMTKSRELYDWYNDISNGKIERRDGSIVVVDIDGVTEVARWNFFDAWPIKWDSSAFTAKGNDVAIESLELACERIERA
ncbi:MAG: phage tail protein [Anaerolineae bacterium]